MAEGPLLEVLAADRIGVWDWDFPTGLMYQNEVLFQLFGRPFLQERDGFLDVLFWTFPDDRQTLGDAVKHSLKTGEEHVLEFRVRLPQGPPCRLLTHRHVTRDPAGRPQRVIRLFQEVPLGKSPDQAQKDRLASLSLQWLDLPLGSIPRKLRLA